MMNIGILGLGWLGKPLAHTLQRDGYSVKGSTTHLTKKEKLLNQGFFVYYLEVQPDEIIGEKKSFFADLDVLIVNIPPKISQQDTKSYIHKMKHILKQVELFQIQKVIYVSTTSVFKDEANFPTYSELDTPNAVSPKATQLIEAEQLMLRQPKVDAAVIRLGGLVGGERHPVLYLSGKTDLTNSNAPVNLIHLQDCILLIKSIIKQNKYQYIYHGVNQVQIPKNQFYALSAKKRNVKPPLFNNSLSIGKQITAEVTQSILSIKLKHEVL